MKGKSNINILIDNVRNAEVVGELIFQPQAKPESDPHLTPLHPPHQPRKYVFRPLYLSISLEISYHFILIQLPFKLSLPFCIILKSKCIRLIDLDRRKLYETYSTYTTDNDHHCSSHSHLCQAKLFHRFVSFLQVLARGLKNRTSG